MPLSGIAPDALALKVVNQFAGRVESVRHTICNVQSVLTMESIGNSDLPYLSCHSEVNSCSG
jgi:hypothetical protein